MGRATTGDFDARGLAVGGLRKLCAAFMCVVLAVGLLPTSAFAQVGVVSGGLNAQSIDALAASDATSVQEAAEAAIVSVENQGFENLVLKDAFEMQLEGSRCYAVDDSVYHVLYGGGYYIFTVGSGNAITVRAAKASEKLAVYDTLEAAKVAIEADAGKAPSAFLTRGRVSDGDRGDAYYVRTDDELNYATVKATGPIMSQDKETGIDKRGTNDETVLDVCIAGNNYRFTSAEDALNIYQLGYADAAAPKSASLYFYMFQNTGFHTFVLPEGDYPTDRGVWCYADDRAYYGLGAEGTWSTLVTDDGFIYDSFIDSVIYVRGKVTWNPTVYATVHDVEINGIGVRCESELGLTDEQGEIVGCHASYRSNVFIRFAEGIIYKNAFINAPQYYTLGLQIYGSASDVTWENVKADVFSGVEIRDLDNNNVGVKNVTMKKCDITTSSFDEGLAIFAGNEEGLGRYDENGVWKEYPIQKDSLVEHVFVEDNTFTMRMTNTAFKKRIVAVTCGYQDSPVRDVVIRNNTFDVYADYTFIQFGYADNCKVEGNTVTMRARDAERDKDSKGNNGVWGNIVNRSSKSRTGATTDVTVSGNTFTLADDEKDHNLRYLINPALDDKALTFSGNTVNFDGYADGQLLSTWATISGNTFNLGDVKSLYSNVKTVSGNTYNIGTLGVLYEANGLSAETDVEISDEQVNVVGMNASTHHLMSFNSKPSYNGHSMTFRDCQVAIENTDDLYRYRRIAGDVSGIVDSLTLVFLNCVIDGFDKSPYNTINKNPGKVTFVMANKKVVHDSIADMKADLALSEGDAVMTSAYYKGGAAGNESAGAAAYKIVATDEGYVDDEGRCIKLDNGCFAVLQPTGSVADLYQFGAKGDGSTDDAAHVQTALQSGVETVHVSSGTYFMAAQVEAGSVSLVGDGAAECRFIAGEDVGSEALFSWRKGKGCGASNVTMSGAGAAFAGCDGVVANELSVVNACGHGVSLTDCKNVAIANLVVNGYALGGNPEHAGLLASGDCSGVIAGAVADVEGSAAAYSVRVTGSGCDLSGLALDNLREGEFPIEVDADAVAYQWASDYSSATATPMSGGVAFAAGSETVKTTSQVVQAATCATKGKTAYTARFSSPVFATQSKTVTDIASLSHAWSAWTKLDEAQHQRVCGRDESHVEKANHTWNAGEVTKEPTTKASGVRTYTCTACKATKTTSIDKLIDVSKASITLATKAYAYNGKAKKPAVTVKYRGATLKNGKHYTLTYSANKNVGTAKVTVTGKGVYGGTKAVTFKINPKATVVSKLTAAKKGFTAKWKKQATQTSGYQLQYSLKKSFKSAKTVTIAKPKTISKKVTKLKPNKKYYVRVRTFKKIGTVRHYSAWSASKSVTTK